MALDPDTLALVKSQEPDRYLAALATIAGAREDLLALAAFAAQARRVPRLARDPLAGEIRLTWWREAVEGLASGGRTGHPIADALAPAVARGHFAVPRLTGFLDALAFDLSPAPFVDEQARSVYIGKTEGALFRLALTRLGASDPADALIEQAAVAYGLARASLRLDAEAPLVTEADLAATGLRFADLSLPEAQRAREAIAARLGAEARAAQAKLPDLSAVIPAGQRAALLPLVMVTPYLDWAARNRVPASQPLVRVWRIWRAGRSGRIGD